MGFREWADVVWDVATTRYNTRYHPTSVPSNPNKSLEKWTVIVTGATRGIGAATARALGRAGATVVLACRRPAAAETLAEAWRGEDGHGTYVALELDLNSLDSVRAFATRVLSTHESIDALINNAGLFRMGVAERTTTEQGYESHFGVNYLGPYLLTQLLFPALLRAQDADGARVVNVSSRLHTVAGTIDTTAAATAPVEAPVEGYAPSDAYARSKLAQVFFTQELQARLPESAKVRVFALHPGNVITDVVRDLPWYITLLWRNLCTWMFLSAEEGAMTSLVAAVEPGLPGGSYLENCRPVATGLTAQDETRSAALWAWTCSELKLQEDWPELAVAAAHNK